MNYLNYILNKIIIFGINPPSLLDKDSFFKYIKNIILKDNNLS